MAPTRCALDKQAGLLVVYPPEQPVRHTRFWHLVVWFTDATGDERGYYAGIGGVQGAFSVLRTPRDQPRFTLCFYPEQDLAKVNNPRLAADRIVFDTGIALSPEARSLYPDLTVEVDLFRCPGPRQRPDQPAKHAHIPRIALPDDPLIELSRVKAKYARETTRGRTREVPVGIAVTPFDGEVQGPTVNDGALGDTLIEVRFVLVEVVPDRSSHPEQPADTLPLSLKNFERLYLPEARVDLTRLGELADRVAACFRFEQQSLADQARGAVQLFSSKDADRVPRDSGYELRFRWRQALPRDRIGVSFRAERWPQDPVSDGAGGDRHRLRVLDAISPGEAVTFGNATGGSAMFLVSSLGFHGAALADGLDDADFDSDSARDRLHPVGEGGRWAQGCEAVEREGLDLRPAAGCGAPLLYSYLAFLQRSAPLSARPEAGVGPLLANLGIDRSSVASYLARAEAAWALLSWPKLLARLRTAGLAREPDVLPGDGLVAWFAAVLFPRHARAIAEWLQDLRPLEQYYAWVLLREGVPLPPLAEHRLTPDYLPDENALDTLRLGLQMVANPTRLRRAIAVLQDRGLPTGAVTGVERVSQLPVLVRQVTGAEEVLNRDLTLLRPSAPFREALDAYLRALDLTEDGLLDQLSDGLAPAEVEQTGELRAEVKALLERLGKGGRIGVDVDSLRSRLSLLLAKRVLRVSADLGERASPLFHWIQRLLWAGESAWSDSESDASPATGTRAMSPLSMSQCSEVIAALQQFESAMPSGAETDQDGFRLPDWTGPRRALHQRLAGELATACGDARRWAAAALSDDPAAGAEQAIVHHRVDDLIDRVDALAEQFAAAGVWRRVLRRLRESAEHPDAGRGIRALWQRCTSPPQYWESIAAEAEAQTQTQTQTQRNSQHL